MEKRIIRIPRGDKIGPERQPIYGWHETQADCEGGLAVHKALKGARWRWMVTHEASGLALSALGAMTKKRALANMRAALALPFDWTMGESETFAALRNSRGIEDAVRRIGESN